MKLEDLPTTLPIYEAKGLVLFPYAQLPLSFKTEEEKELIDSAMQTKQRLLGVVQINPEGGHFQKGCVGKIINYQEDKQIFAILRGLCRFNIMRDFEDGGLKKAEVTYQDYEKDLDLHISDPFVNRERLLNLLKEYLDEQDIMANWDEIDQASDDLILSSLSMACPFKPLEKQALLETKSLSERCEMMIALMEMAAPHLKDRGQVLH